MKVTLTASTGVRVVVWRAGDAFYARRPNETAEPQICLAVDLFEVLADLTGLDLDRSDHVAEAIALGEEAQRRLSAEAAPPPQQTDAETDERRSS